MKSLDPLVSCHWAAQMYLWKEWLRSAPYPWRWIRADWRERRRIHSVDSRRFCQFGKCDGRVVWSRNGRTFGARLWIQVAPSFHTRSLRETRWVGL